MVDVRWMFLNGSRLTFRHEIAAFHVLFSGEDVIKLAAGEVVWNLPVFVDRQHDREHGGEVRGRLQKYPSFV